MPPKKTPAAGLHPEVRELEKCAEQLGDTSAQGGGSGKPAEGGEGSVAAFVIAGEGDAAATLGFEDNLDACAKAGLRVKGTKWSGGHAMPPAGEACYAAMVEHLLGP